MSSMKTNLFFSTTLKRGLTGLLSLYLLTLPVKSRAEGFRGLPVYVQVKSVDFTPEELTNIAHVCYEFRTTIPYIDEQYFLYQQSGGLFGNATYIDKAGNPVSGSQPKGIEFEYTIYNRFSLYAYINADKYSLDTPEISYYSRFVRTGNNGKPRDIEKMSENVSFDALIYPEYEVVTYCEDIAFEKAYSEAYIRSFFENPFMIGHIMGWSRYRVSLLFSIFPSLNKDVEFSPSEYVVPIFGMNADVADDYLIVQASHYMNSILFLTENLDIEHVNRLRDEYSDVIDEFEAKYNINVPESLGIEDIIYIFIKVKDLFYS